MDSSIAEPSKGRILGQSVNMFGLAPYTDFEEFNEKLSIIHFIIFTLIKFFLQDFYCTF
jgi:hypothetical protein